MVVSDDSGLVSWALATPRHLLCNRHLPWKGWLPPISKAVIIFFLSLGRVQKSILSIPSPSRRMISCKISSLLSSKGGNVLDIFYKMQVLRSRLSFHSQNSLFNNTSNSKNLPTCPHRRVSPSSLSLSALPHLFSATLSPAWAP